MKVPNHIFFIHMTSTHPPLPQWPAKLPRVAKRRRRVAASEPPGRYLLWTGTWRTWIMLVGKHRGSGGYPSIRIVVPGCRHGTIQSVYMYIYNIYIIIYIYIHIITYVVCPLYPISDDKQTHSWCLDQHLLLLIPNFSWSNPRAQS